jgi:hypothetical protein
MTTADFSVKSMTDIEKKLGRRVVVESGFSRYQFHRHIAVTVISGFDDWFSEMASLRRQLSEQPYLQRLPLYRRLSHPGDSRGHSDLLCRREISLPVLGH